MGKQTMKKYVRQHIPTWVERCDIHDGRIVSNAMIQERMQAEIDDLRAALEAARQRLECVSQYVNDEFFEQLGVAV